MSASTGKTHNNVKIYHRGPNQPILVTAPFKTCGIRVGGVRFSAGAGNFSLHHCLQTDSGAHPASYPMGTRGFFLGVKRSGREADHSPPSSAEVKNAWSYTSFPHCIFMAWCLV
jgi:hypothetical protein